MSDHFQLQFKTRGDVPPNGRPRIYFCCHPKDFDIYFGEITEDIFNIQNNVAFWYYNPSDRPDNSEELFNELHEMQLFVVPITSRFLFDTADNYARTVEFTYAIEHNIPILPLMQDKSLCSDFNRICGDFQGLNKNSREDDPTALPYEDKLKKFLESVLVSDELAEKIRSAFDAYIFLSYRKKDRKYAQQLMRLIHENDFCRDIAIWYDEFLVPGEHFNDAISKALDKCDLFALAVTPHLLEDNNYVMTTEYPAAVQHGKQILPVEMVETDRNEMKKHYGCISNIVSAEDKPVLSDSLLEYLKGFNLLSNDEDPQHMFFIGLAYLAGIDVEVNHKKAVDLITRAAEKDYPAAYRKLVDMYNTGEGVERDYKTAIEWQIKYVDMLERTIVDPYAGNNVITALMDLGYMQSEIAAYSEAKSTYEKLLEYTQKSFELYSSFSTVRNLADSYFNLGGNAYDLGDFISTLKYYTKAMAIRESLVAETNSIEDRRELAGLYNNLGVRSNDLGIPNSAREFYAKAMAIRESLVAETNSIEDRRNLASSYSNFGISSRDLSDISSAIELFNKAISIKESLVTETNSIEDRRSLADSYNNYGVIYYDLDEFSSAIELFNKTISIRESLASETNSIEDRRKLAMSYNNLGLNSNDLGDLSSAMELFNNAISIREILVAETNSIEDKRALANSYNNLGLNSKNIGDSDSAKNLYIKAISIREALVSETNSIEDKRNLATIYFNLGIISDTDSAKEFYTKALSIRESLVTETNSIEDRRNLANSCNNLGILYENSDDLNSASEFYTKAISIRESLASETNFIKDRIFLAESYCNLGISLCESGNYISGIDYINKALNVAKFIQKESNSPQISKFILSLQDNLNHAYQSSPYTLPNVHITQNVTPAEPIEINEEYESILNDIDALHGQFNSIGFTIDTILDTNPTGIFAGKKKRALKEQTFTALSSIQELCDNEKSMLDSVPSDYGRAPQYGRIYAIHLERLTSYKNKINKKFEGIN